MSSIFASWKHRNFCAAKRSIFSRRFSDASSATPASHMRFQVGMARVEMLGDAREVLAEVRGGVDAEVRELLVHEPRHVARLVLLRRGEISRARAKSEPGCAGA